MRQSIRALGWATNILWIATAAFMVTSLYSPLKMMLERQIEIGSPQTSFSNGTITMSLPFFVNNTGFYDISDLNVTTSVADYNGTLISTSTTFVQNIPRGENVSKTHRMPMSLKDIISKNLTYLLFNDTTFILNVSIGLKIAHVIPLQVSTNATWDWGAPLYNFPPPYSDIPCNFTDHKMLIPLSFENHARFGVKGTMRLQVYNSQSEIIGSKTVPVNVPSHSKYCPQGDQVIEIDPSKRTETGQVHFLFETSMFTLYVVRNWVTAHG